MAVITVTTLDDSTAPEGEISLREALQAANTDTSVDGSTPGSGADTIVFDPSLNGTLVLTQGQLTISSNVTIDGDVDGDNAADITIDANSASRVLHVTGGTSTLHSLTMTGGRVAGTADDGGGILIAGGANLTIVSSTVSGSYAGRNGGGIANHGDVTLINSTLSGNTANRYGGGLHSGDISATAETATLINTTVAGNSAYGGGGININSGSILTLSSSTVSGNSADPTSGYGGGLYNGGTATLTNSIVAGNESATDAETSTLSVITFAGVNVIGVGLDSDASDGVIQTPTLDALFDTGVLADNGGPVQTIALQDGSVAQDGGDSTALPADTKDLDGDTDIAENLPVDARGFARVFGADVDIGAFEMQPLNAAPVFEGALADGAQAVSLAENSANAIAVFNVDANDGDGGATDAGLAYTITAGNGNADGDGNLAFAIDALTGAITVNDADDLDFEAGASFTLAIEADDGGATPNTATATVTVNLTDLAETFTVTTLVDENDVGATVGNPGGSGLSLREALALANRGATTADTIRFAAALSGGTLFLTSGQLAITTDGITVDGDIDGNGDPDITIDADSAAGLDDAASRVFFISDGGPGTISAALNGLVIRDGNPGGGFPANAGGGIFVGLADALALTNSTVSGNSAIYGGGILGDTNAAITLTNSTVSGNSAARLAGGIGVATDGAITLVNSTVSGNSAVYSGGGIFGNPSAEITLTNSIVSGNSAGRDGGGILGNADATITLTNVTVSGNSAGDDGGGISGALRAAITLTNATVSGNSAGDNGGGIYGYANNPITLVNTTVTGNSAGGDGGAIYNFGSSATTALSNSIVAGNAATGAGDDLFGGSNSSADLVLTGGTIVGSAPANFATTTGAPTAQIDGSNQAALETVFAAVANDPHTGVLAGTLALNGGPVQTVALRAALTNPALDAGDDGLAAPTDARGLARLDQTNVANNDANISDLGAYELQGVVEAASLVVTTLDDVVDPVDGVTSLREALALANSPADGGDALGDGLPDVITFAAALAGGTLFLTTGQQLEITTDGITVDGDTDGDGDPDITIDADSAAGLDDAASRVFLISDGNDATTISVTLNGLVIQDGNAGGGAGDGGGIYVGAADALALTGSTVSGNSADFGGGILGGTNAAITLTNSAVSGNSAARLGGGIAGAEDGAITLVNSIVSDNRASDDGGGIYGGDNAAIMLTNATMSDNSAGGNGGGIYGFANNPITLINTTVTGNSADGNGGGIYGYAGNPITLINSTVTGNSTDGNGGGIYNVGSSATVLSNSIIAGNAATGAGDDLFGGYNSSADLVFTGGNVIGSAPANFATTTGTPTAQIDGTSQAELETVFAAVANDPHTGVLAGVLADNGGPVQTVALRAALTNPALDAGDDGLAAPTDARGLAHLDQTNVANNGANISDLGAYELQGVVEAASLVVTTLDDVVDPFDHLTSLREALALANSPADGGDALADGLADVITFAAALAGGTLFLTTGQQLEITTDGITVDGDTDGDGDPDITIDADSAAGLDDAASRVFFINDGNDATTISAALNGLVIQNGNAAGGAGDGGGIHVGRADALTLTNATVSGSSAGRFGGGIFGDANSNVALTNATVSGNSAGRDGGGIDGETDSTITLTNAIVSGNSAGEYGGGVFGFTGITITLTNATVSGNSAGDDGGGIYGGRNAAITLTNATVSRNSAGDDGGAIYGRTDTAITLTNATVSGNSAVGNGGGIYGFLNNPITLVNTTVTGNSAGGDGGAIYNFGSSATTALSNSIVAGNAATGAGDDLFGGNNSSADVVFTGGNIVGSAPANFASQTGAPTAQIDGTSQAALETVFAAVANDPHTGVLSGALALNGGPVQTVALRAALTNPALDAGEDGLAAPTDARGLARLDQTNVANNGANISDLGAYELQGVVEAASLVVTTLDDVVDPVDGVTSLREALALANSPADGGDALGDGLPDVITFAAALAGGTLFLTTGQQLEITTDGITIDGDIDGNGDPDITIDADSAAGLDDAASRVFFISDGNDATTISATLNGLVIQDGNAAGGADGGGIYVGATDALALTGSTVSGNSADFGGGILGGTNAAITLTNSAVSGNSAARFGGGIGGAEDGAITLVNSIVSDNRAGDDGGGIYGGENAAIMLTNATMSGNSADRDGGGIYGGYNAAIMLTNATISGNSAGDDGGGIYGFANNPITLINTTVTGNSAGGDGGAIYNYGSSATTALSNSIIAGNAATGAGDDLFGGYNSSADLVFTGGNVIGSAPANFATTTGAPTAQIDGTSQAALETVFAAVANDPHTGVLSGALALNGGPVQTVAIKTGGVAHNTGDNGELPADAQDLDGDSDTSENLPFDARGETRVMGGTVDIGAYEVQNSAPVQVANTGLNLNESASATIVAAQLDYNDAQEPPADVTYTITTAVAIGTLLLNGVVRGLGSTFTQDDIDNNRLTYAHDGSETSATSFGFSVTDGVNPPVTGQNFAIAINAVNDLPVNSVPGAQSLEANHSLAITGLSVADPDAGAGAMSVALSVDHGTLAVSALGGAGVAGSGTSAVLVTGTLAAINATLAGSNVVYAPTTDWFDDDTLTMVTNDGGNTGVGGALSDTDTVAIDLHTHLFGTPDNDAFAVAPGNVRIDGLGGFGDTITFDFRLVDASVRYVGNTVIIDGPSSHTVLTGFEVFQFTDGTVENNDTIRLVDDLFYYSKYHDVWNAHVDADAHFVSFGRDEGRDPNAFFSIVVYRSANPDVAVAGVNPLDHFDAAGWLEGRVPSIHFDPAQYLAANPDVAAAGVNPLRHYLQFGYQEGREPFAPTELIGANGFDFVYYLNHNPDVAAAGVDPFEHFQTFGWQEGRNPNALFDTNGYLSTNGDVAAAHVNPLDHYNTFGWHEGRDPSPGFDTTDYLAAYADVAAAGVNPLAHFLHFGIHEGRSPFADGVWG